MTQRRLVDPILGYNGDPRMMRWLGRDWRKLQGRQEALTWDGEWQTPPYFRDPGPRKIVRVSSREGVSFADMQVSDQTQTVCCSGPSRTAALASLGETLLALREAFDTGTGSQVPANGHSLSDLG